VSTLESPATTASRPSYHHGDLREALIAAALALLIENQGWGFSLREVARRAGVSHNAPYNHFDDKRDLLGAVGAAGYEALRARMLAAKAGITAPEPALVAIGDAYVRFGIENPAHYRLMFGPELIACGAEPPPECVLVAAMAAKSVLAEAILWGVREGRFAAPQADDTSNEMLVLTAWSLVHGLTMLMIDGLAGVDSASATPLRVAVTLLEGVRSRPVPA
jgi:AcrR family transcriptional regulator